MWTTLAILAATLTWIPGSTVKVEQMIGDCDSTAQARTGQCVPTTSQTAARAKVLGTDLGASFESEGRVIFLFGDTISPSPSENYFAADTMASSVSTDPSQGLFLDFFTNNDHTPYFVRIPGVKMGAGEVPHAGIRLKGATYIVVTTGADIHLPDPNINEYSVLTRFDEATRRFTVLRTISSRPNGKFITTALRQSGDNIYIFGLGAYRRSDVYLSVGTAEDFESGRGTRYFTGLINGQPTWSPSEADAVPVVADNPTPGIGNVSVIYSNDLRLWLMTYDTGTGPRETRGFYFTYAPDPWGPWQPPQLIFNPTRDGAAGTFIHDPRITPSDGLTGPTIGPNDPTTTPGGPYAPYLVERFTRVDAHTLSIYYTLSTWNPYTIVLMRSDFRVSEGASRRRSMRH